MKLTVFWDVALCSLVETNQHFRGEVLTATTITLMMETVSTSETSVSFYKTTWCNIPEGSHLQENRGLQFLSD
jgi:hypothetical protein